MNTIEVTIKGDRMLMHNGQLADPMNPYTKALKLVTGKKKKDDDDHEGMAEAEFQGGLYHDEEVGPFLPGMLIDATLVDGAKKRKLGKEFKAAVRVVEEIIPLRYKGPRGRKELWADTRFRDRRGVKVQSSRVIRTRPMFTDWSVTFTVEIDGVDVSDLRSALDDAGARCGIGDYRPRFGQFTVVSFKQI